MSDLSNFNYKCPKCGHNTCKVGQVRAAGGFWSKIFDLQNRKFSSVTCQQCKYTELYEAESSMLGNIFDFFTN